MSKSSSKKDDTQPLLANKDFDTKNQKDNDESSDDRIDEEELQIRNEYEEAFQIFDKDRTGYLSDKDLLVVLRALGQNPSEAEFQEILAKIDQDNTGKINLHEFIKFIRSQTEEFSARKELKECFELFTDDPKGKLDRKTFFSILKAPKHPFTKGEMTYVFSKFNDLSTIDDYVDAILNEPAFSTKKKD